MDLLLLGFFIYSLILYYILAEIGVNHNGKLNLVKHLIHESINEVKIGKSLDIFVMI